MIGSGTRFNQFRPSVSQTLINNKADFRALFENSDKDRDKFVVEVENYKTFFSSLLVTRIERDGIYLGNTLEEAKEALSLFMPEVAEKI